MPSNVIFPFKTGSYRVWWISLFTFIPHQGSFKGVYICTAVRPACRNPPPAWDNAKSIYSTCCLQMDRFIAMNILIIVWWRYSFYDVIIILIWRILHVSVCGTRSALLGNWKIGKFSSKRVISNNKYQTYIDYIC